MRGALLWWRAVSRARAFAQRLAVPVAIYLVCATVYVAVLGPRRDGPSPNDHFVLLADSLLHGRLEVAGPPYPWEAGAVPRAEFNDWSCFRDVPARCEEEAHSNAIVHAECDHHCPPTAPNVHREGEHWYVSFPPLPSIVILPAVALFGTTFSDPLFWALFAGLAPALLHVLLRSLRERKISERSPKEDLLLVTLFAFGSVYFFCSVQGSVWFSAQVVCSALLILYLLFAIDARRPLWAGVLLGLCFLTRPTTLVFALFFVLEAMRVSSAERGEPEGSIWRRLARFVAQTKWVPAIRAVAIFGAPLLVVGLLAMWMNAARFHDPFEFGHRYLQIRWQPRIEKWGLFNYHYLSKNLAVFLASLPWISGSAPYLTISRHGLAFWVTSPNLLPAFWPKKIDARMTSLFVAVAGVALWNLCYQNSGWVQFGYRFLLDYLPALIVLLALGKRRFGPGFIAVLVLAIGINLFGAITFDRAWMFYDDDGAQDRLFHPD